MKKEKVYILISLLTTVCLCTVIYVKKSEFFYLGGIEISETNQAYWAHKLKENGFNTVSVTKYAEQGVWNSDNLNYTELDSTIIRQIKTAKKNRLKVFLLPRVSLNNELKENKFIWHGMISFINDSLQKSWFDKYENFILMCAKSAEELDVDVLGLGSEMNALTATKKLSIKNFKKRVNKQSKAIFNYDKYTAKIASQLQEKYFWTKDSTTFGTIEDYFRESFEAKLMRSRSIYCDTLLTTLNRINRIRERNKKRWKDLIVKVRKVYNGKLTFAANFDNYHKVSFWNDLDIIGINAYYSLRDGNQLNTNKSKEIRDAWDIKIRKIKKFKESQGLDMPVVFTELGYTFTEDCTLRPWAHEGFTIVGGESFTRLMKWKQRQKNYSERVIAIQELNNTLSKYPKLLQGVLYWKLSTNTTHKDHEDFLVLIDKNKNIGDPILQELNKLKAHKF